MLGYFPEKFLAKNMKTTIFLLKGLKTVLFPSLFAVLSIFKVSKSSQNHK